METNKAIQLMVAIFGAFGIADTLASGNGAAEVFLQAISIVATAVVVFSWASLDARSAGRQLSTVQIVCIVVFGYLAVPFYLAKNRAPGARARPIGKGILVFLACLLAFAFTSQLVSGVLP
jgi:cellobiose-specific phosphotransferase system component IIC